MVPLSETPTTTGHKPSLPRTSTLVVDGEGKERQRRSEYRWWWGNKQGRSFHPHYQYIYIYIYRSTSTSHANSLQDENKLSSLDSINVSITIIAWRFFDIAFFFFSYSTICFERLIFFYRFRIVFLQALYNFR